jgi:hypothetical protein
MQLPRAGTTGTRHTTRGPDVKKLLGWIALGIAVLWVINNPDQAALIVHKTGHAIATLIHA